MTAEARSAGRPVGSVRALVLAGLVLAAATPALGEAPQRAGPPSPFIDRGVCPFEGCSYRKWTASADVALLDRPGGSRTGVVVTAGESVDAVTGEVHVVPLRVVARRPMAVPGEHVAQLEAGEVFYLLSYVGEGYFRTWVRGEIRVMDVDFGWQGRGTCSESAAGCDSEPEGGRSAFLKWRSGGAVWWVKVRTSTGAEGWTREAVSFRGKDLLE